MRKIARILVSAAVAGAFVLPASQADAVYCGTLHPACQAICRVGQVVDAQCLA
jgi:hypothetical protein